MHMPRGTQVINGTEYVYEYDSTWNAKKKYGTHQRNYIGKIVDGAFIPNKKYTLQQELEQAKKRGPAPVTECKRTFYGATYLFDAIGETLGVTADLKKCFPDTYTQILSIAYYLILEDRNPLSRFPKWARTHAHPFGANIASQRSSELFGSISENAKSKFFRLQSGRRLEKEYLAYDTTSISSYSKLIRQVKYGKNKDHEHLAQLNLALLYGHQSRLPVYYRKLPGNIPDVMTIKKLLFDIDFLELKKVKLVMDRGFYSEANINALYRSHYKFLLAVTISRKLVQEQLNKVREQTLSRTHYSSKHKLYYYPVLITWPYQETKKRSGQVEFSEKRMYLHLFYNHQQAADDQAAFNELLDGLEAELLSSSPNPVHEALYKKYYQVKETPVQGIKLTPKQEAINEAKKNYGYFALISNDLKDPLEALQVYRCNDVIEKAFGNLKERLNMRRTSVSSEENLEGKLFVQFVALIYLAYIDKARCENNLYKSYTLQELLDELDVIERFEHPGQRHHIGEMTKKQIELYHQLGVDAPS
ncbi:MAG: IS1634 family transposase [Candidatus Atribacteria bacterium]|nr:IS1634 family transposase [Candidatus Atribacteria bacterium]